MVMRLFVAQVYAGSIPVHRPKNTPLFRATQKGGAGFGAASGNRTPNPLIKSQML